MKKLSKKKRVVVIICIILGLSIIGSILGDEKMDIPDLTKGDSSSYENGDVVSKYAYSDTVEEGAVIEQIPPAQQDVAREEIDITLVYSKGKAPIIPDFAEMSQDEIDDWKDEYDVSILTTKKYSELKNDTLISQSLQAGTSAPIKEPVLEKEAMFSISLVYSKGEAPKIPDFTDMKKSDVESWGEEHNITINFESAYSRDVKNGDIISQDVEASTSIEEVSSIAVVYSIGREETIGETNAVSKAQDYLDYTSFSRSGLIDQLEYEGFTTDESTYAVDKLNVDWNEQAAGKAKDYLDYTSFSRSGLIDQLEYEGFTYDQAVYGVTQNGY